MSLDSYGTRLTRRDVTELANASELLAVAADTIRRYHPQWGEAVVNLLIVVNTRIERIQNKGAAAFARYLEKHGMEGAQDVTEISAPAENTRAEREVDPRAQQDPCNADRAVTPAPLFRT